MMTNSRLRMVITLVGVFVLLVLVGIANTGIKHVDVIVNNIVLVEQNDSLRTEMKLLKHALDSNNTTTVDSIMKMFSVVDSTRQAVYVKLDSTQKQLQDAKANSVISPHNVTPYRLEPVELPSSEDY